MRQHSSAGVRKPFKPPRVVGSVLVAAHQTSPEPQTKPSDEKVNNAKSKALKRLLFPYVKKLTTMEIASIKDNIKKKQHIQEQPSIEVSTSDHSSRTSDCSTVEQQSQQESSVVKKRPSLSLRRKQNEGRKRKQSNSIQSPHKKADLAKEHQKSATMSPRHAGHSQEKVSTKPTVRDDEVLSTRYHELQFEASREQWQPPDDHHCYISDNSDALINMGYLSPSESTHVDPPEIPILQSPHKSPSPLQCPHFNLPVTSSRHNIFLRAA